MYLLCPYGVTKGDLKLRGSKSPSRTVATKKIGNLLQDCPTGGEVSLGNAEPPVPIRVVIITSRAFGNADFQ
jgi:hypothetical protein